MKKITGIIVTALALFALGACGSSGGSSSSSSDKSENQLAAIKKSGVLKVATSADYAPFEFHTMVDGKDKIVGSDIDLVNEIAKELGVKAEVSDMSFNTVLASLKEGKSDIAISAISATDERKEQFDFTDNYYNPPQVVVINKKNKDAYTSTDALKDKNVGAQKGSIQEDVVKTQIEGSKLVTIDKVPNMVVEVNQGSLDAMVVEKTIAESYIAQNPDLTIADITLKPSADEAFAIALPKGSSDLQKELNTIIKKLNDEGKVDEFIKKNNELAEKTATE
ncbi:transporter substrate-binding domain-containing protein [Enterococcus durans]|uniref:transporter substrate-binding domain-containing protein n=1 Tax=Enterococcus durans TaxID=53345 RepID=UPI00232B5415|nr:transporter substrate-binding domain-containing protein [Enterococcus durans]MDB1654154.1 transporter substrate-binding domain-containing protein [Enterococcus durans]MDB1656128.1 transporter substrate-binding domain-containing protein [Enterococcus durans]MDB1664843.1 transporter substrate-binding domain-containing protein [Enterococcus durans]MDB1669893.1 transporter substrate-binding domain-containing protein [Enterococcus durans]MDB1672637.1 transporter substrate-binding domain-containi